MVWNGQTIFCIYQKKHLTFDELLCIIYIKKKFMEIFLWIMGKAVSVQIGTWLSVQEE